MCAAEVLLYGLKDWWIRERKKGLLDANIAERPDCPDGTTCRRQREQGKVFFV
jgi:E3 ubiquitin-protein ligase CHFR